MRTVLSLLVIMMVAAPLLRADDTVPDITFVGTWTGTARMDGIEFKHITFAVEIVIRANGSVTGKVGEAQLVEAHFKRHRSKNVSRRESPLMDYMIHGGVSGPILAEKNLTAEEIFIPLDFQDGKFDAAVNSHGTSIGGVPHGIMSSHMQLTKKK